MMRHQTSFTDTHHVEALLRELEAAMRRTEARDSR
jgi:hypothetical protein